MAKHKEDFSADGQKIGLSSEDPNRIIGANPSLLLTKQNGKIAFYTLEEDTFFVAPGGLGIVTFRTAKVLLWSKKLKDNVMLSSVCLN